MMGMGPYVSHAYTPLGASVSNSEAEKEKRLELSLKMIALTRIFLKDVNIASTTALQSLDPQGRELALKAGANIIMPNLTPTQYREDYLLYENKPCIDEDAAQCKGCLALRIASCGDEVGWKEWGDSPHYFKRKAREENLSCAQK